MRESYLLTESILSGHVGGLVQFIVNVRQPAKSREILRLRESYLLTGSILSGHVGGLVQFIVKRQTARQIS